MSLGTPGYISPNILQTAMSSKTLQYYDGIKADVWSLGMLLCELLFKSLPYRQAAPGFWLGGALFAGCKCPGWRAPVFCAAYKTFSTP